MPPMSTMCPEALAQPMRARRRKIGRMTTTSCRWSPPPSCGSLARNTSPGAMRLPKRARTAATAPAHTPKWNGTVDAVATMRPAASYRMQEKSRASLIRGETAVFTIAAAISRVRCCRRLRTTSSVIGSSPSATAHLDDEAPPRVDVRPVACRHEDGRVPPLDQRGAAERHARGEALAVVECDRTAVLAAGEPHGSHAAPRRRRIRLAERRRREGRAWQAGGGDHAAVDEVDRRRRRERTRAVELGVARAEGVAEPAGLDERHGHLPSLLPEAEV